MKDKGARQYGGTNLGGHELWGAAERACCRPIPHVFLAETVIGHLDVSLRGKEDVVELQVTIDDAVLVEILERQADLGGVESGQMLDKAKGKVAVDSAGARAGELTALASLRTVRAGCAASDRRLARIP